MILLTACFIPQRVISAIMAFFAIALAYMLRISLSYAITQMVVRPNTNHNGTVVGGPGVCPIFDDERATMLSNSTAHLVDNAGRYDWSQSLQGLILSAFYWGYIVTHVPGGLLSAKIGGKYTIALGIFVATLFTLLTPYAIEMGKLITHTLIIYIDGSNLF